MISMQIDGLAIHCQYCLVVRRYANSVVETILCWRIAIEPPDPKPTPITEQRDQDRSGGFSRCWVHQPTLMMGRISANGQVLLSPRRDIAAVLTCNWSISREYKFETSNYIYTQITIIFHCVAMLGFDFMWCKVNEIKLSFVFSQQVF